MGGSTVMLKRLTDTQVYAKMCASSPMENCKCEWLPTFCDNGEDNLEILCPVCLRYWFKNMSFTSLLHNQSTQFLLKYTCRTWYLMILLLLQELEN